MEYRYYIIRTLVFICLQLLVWAFARTLTWLFSVKQKKLILWISFITVNSWVVWVVLTSVAQFRYVALLFVLLMFSFFIRMMALSVFWLGGKGRRLDTALRFIYPFALIGIIGLSVYNAYTPKITYYAIQLDKPLEKPLRVGVASDTHLGLLFGNHQLDQLAEIFQQQKVDLILLPGDIMDDSTDVYVAENMRTHLAKLRAPLGVYATLGNHDIEHRQAIEAEIQRAGITLLSDQAVNLAGKLHIVGRSDNLVATRPQTRQLIETLDKNLPIFLLDHRPDNIEEHAQLPIDLQVSGHTHNGQIFPANLITAMLYRLSYGYEKIGNGHFFVTSGYGFWGVPMRLGSQSEVMIIDVKGQ